MPRITQARAQVRRRQIIDAALICFARHGFRKTTMRHIVKQSALSLGAIYCHFKGKHEIILAVVEDRHRRESELLRGALGHDNLASAFGDLVTGFIAALEDAGERDWRKLTIQLWAESLYDRRLAAAARQGVDAPLAMLANMIELAKTRGELPRALNEEATGRLLIAFFQGIVLQKAWDPSVDGAACANALALLIGAPKAT
jgi:AcrR family transcriptional regulator